jgi:hypothetical protein
VHEQVPASTHLLDTLRGITLCRYDYNLYSSTMGTKDARDNKSITTVVSGTTQNEAFFGSWILDENTLSYRASRALH